ncbi:TPA: odaE, partial [Escherichia coli]|nr:odaE [Escherichia coli]
MTKNKYATVDFDQVNEKGLKPLIAAINKTGVTVIEVDSSNRATTKDGVKVKTAKLVLNDGQILAIQVNDTGDISSVKLNGKAIP